MSYIRRIVRTNDNTAATLPPISPEPYYPSLDNVLETRDILRNKVRHEQGVPDEIVDLIIDEAEYWPSVEVGLEERIRIGKDGDRPVVETLPLCYDEEALRSSAPSPLPHRTIHPCRKVVFRIASHDQGWASHGTRGSYEGAWSWFDAVVNHPTHGRIPARAADSNPNTTDDNNDTNDTNDNGDETTDYDQVGLWKLQSNRVGHRDTMDYTITWHYLDDIQPDSEEADKIEREQGRGRYTLDGHIVRELQVGDSITVWARARFPGWQNHVEGMAVRVFWAV